MDLEGVVIAVVVLQVKFPKLICIVLIDVAQCGFAILTWTT